MFALNLPNVLTLLRILLVPVLVVALLDETANGDLLAAIVFALASATDAMDGYLARTRNDITTFGMLIISALVALVSLHRLAGWVAMVIIARELTVTVTRMQATQHGVVIAANWWGKAKTIVQVAAIFALIVAGEPTPAWVDGLVYGAVAITIVSGIDYFFGLRRVLREAEARRAESVTAAASASSPAAPAD
jgi:CDP-diacylglycerol--glycerol-3-phosphate 3-phosphatidyltransferase